MKSKRASHGAQLEPLLPHEEAIVDAVVSMLLAEYRRECQAVAAGVVESATGHHHNASRVDGRRVEQRNDRGGVSFSPAASQDKDQVAKISSLSQIAIGARQFSAEFGDSNCDE